MKAQQFLKSVTIINLLVATGFSLTGIIRPELILAAGTSLHKAVYVFALYAAARTVPLAVITILSFVKKQKDIWVTLAFLAGTIQLLDGVIGIYEKDTAKTLGPFLIAGIEFYAIFLYVRKLNKASVNISKD